MSVERFYTTPPGGEFRAGSTGPCTPRFPLAPPPSPTSIHARDVEFGPLWDRRPSLRDAEVRNYREQVDRGRMVYEAPNLIVTNIASHPTSLGYTSPDSRPRGSP